MSNVQKLTPFLMFQNGLAEEAMGFYTDLFDGQIDLLDRYGQETPGMEGKIRLAMFTIAGQQVNIIDSSIQHQFELTPSMSLFVRCASETELDHLWNGLLAGGAALMPKGDYGFGPYGWLNDRYGVSWQLSIAGDAAETGETDGE